VRGFLVTDDHLFICQDSLGTNIKRKLERLMRCAFHYGPAEHDTCNMGNSNLPSPGSGEDFDGQYLNYYLSVSMWCENASFGPFYTPKGSFCQDRLGTHTRKTQKEMRFSQELARDG
jgi:hypothetical protein